MTAYPLRSARLLLAGSLVLAGLLSARTGRADEDRNAAVRTVVQEFVQPGDIELPIGATRKGTLIWCLVPRGALLPQEGLTRIVIAAGLDGDPRTVEAFKSHHDLPLLGSETTGRSARIRIPIANPDAWYDCVNGIADHRPLTFPPKGTAYNTTNEIEIAVLSRFLKWFAPDVLIEIVPPDDPDYRATIESGVLTRESQGWAWYAQGIAHNSRARLRSAWVPAHLLGADPASFEPITREFLNLDAALRGDTGAAPTAANAIARRQRPPLEVTRQLLQFYGDRLSPAMYQPALALVARLRYGELTNDPTQREQVGRILEPYLAGQRAALDERTNGSNLSGQLIFAAWASQPGSTPDPRAIDWVKQAADRAFHPNGEPREAMPSHNEMSDAVFMACPILTAAGRLTGEAKYIDMANRHFEFMQRLCLREDGLYRHSPLCEAPWGRGNGFPALGLALALTDLDQILQSIPETAADTTQAALRQSAARTHASMLTALRAHLQALLPHQDPTGAWRQVIDHPGSYRELTASCMITVALARGLRKGWLDEATFRPAVDRAWEAIQMRVYEDGVLIDVCTGTGKQKTLKDYLDREAIFSRDERGGAMALLAALEMAELLSGSQK